MRWHIILFSLLRNEVVLISDSMGQIFKIECVVFSCFRFPDEDAKVKAQLEQANKALSRELEEVKSTLSDTEQTLKTTEKQNVLYHDHLFKSSNTLMATVKGMLAVLKKVRPP